jgi:hypothetical protein
MERPNHQIAEQRNDGTTEVQERRGGGEVKRPAVEQRSSGETGRRSNGTVERRSSRATEQPGNGVKERVEQRNV